VAEAATVGRARGIALDIDYAERTMELFAGYPPSTRPSMLEDLQVGRRLELETITGAALRMGREHGVSMPANSAIYAALKPYVDGPPTIPVPPT
jgi:2-dehydropantoate 2-reductase